MPIYEYQCQDCDKQLEALQKISEPLLVECPSCGQPSLRKKVSAAAFRLKGAGWYETDFKTSGKKNLASGSEEKAPAASDSKPSDKSGGSSGDSAKKTTSESKKTA